MAFGRQDGWLAYVHLQEHTCEMAPHYTYITITVGLDRFTSRNESPCCKRGQWEEEARQLNTSISTKAFATFLWLVMGNACCKARLTGTGCI
jgi:hypothetical protein